MVRCSTAVPAVVVVGDNNDNNNLNWRSCGHRGVSLPELPAAAYLNDKEITTVGPKTETQIEFSFQDGDILKIVEFDVAIIMFNDFKVVTCYESCIGKIMP